MHMIMLNSQIARQYFEFSFVSGLVVLPLYSGLPRADQVRNTYVDLVSKFLLVLFK